MIGSVIDWILDGVWVNRLRYANLFPGQWADYRIVNANISLLTLLIGCLVGGILVAIGLPRKKIDKANLKPKVEGLEDPFLL